MISATAPIEPPSTYAAELASEYPVLFARFMLPDLSEHACQVTGLSIDCATFLTSYEAAGGLQIVAYLEDVGRVEGVSAESVPGGFRVVFPHTGGRRDRFAARLEWLKNRTAAAGPDSRRHTRFEPADAKSHITLPDGRVYPCEVIDISLSGAALKVAVIPGLGTYIMLGKMRGRIVRYLDNGIALEFVKTLEGRQLSEQVR